MVKLKKNPPSLRNRPTETEPTMSRTLSFALSSTDSAPVGTNANTSSTRTKSHSVQRPLPQPPTNPYAFDSLNKAAIVLRSQAQVAQHVQHPHARLGEPKTEVERYWAMRALKAEMELKSSGGKIETTGEKYRDQLAHDLRAQTLERIVWTLLFTFVSLLLFLTYRLTHVHSTPPPSTSWWSLNVKFPHHFVIPVFSPFASVAEQSHSTIPFNAIAVTVIVAGFLAYGMFRYWMSQNRGHLR